MTENYAAKRERVQRAQAGLPAGLRSRVSLRNAEAVAGLSAPAQATLEQALAQGLKSLPQAVRLLQQNPATFVSELLIAVGQVRRTQPSAILAFEPATARTDTPPDTLPALTALIQTCYPDMPRLAAEALAGAPAMQGLRAVMQAHQDVLAAQPSRSDFVMVTFYGLLRQTQERLRQVISDTPAYQQALRQSGAGWQD